jgi:TRAP-type mannitol/chloroaromatic compound transport system substrate-binding protein
VAKIRIGGFAGKVRTMGAVLGVPGGEVQALEEETIDAAEWVVPETRSWVSIRLPFTTTVGGRAAWLDAFVNKAACDKLSNENKAILESAATLHTDMQVRRQEPEALKQLVAARPRFCLSPRQ